MPKPQKIYRADHLPCPLNQGKRARVDGFIETWLEGVALESRAAWREWSETGQFRSTVVTKGEPAVASHALLGTSFGQMAMSQSRAVWKGWVAGLEDRIRRCIADSSLSPERKHALHSLNRQQAWGGRPDLTLQYGPQNNKQLIPEADHRLFRVIVRHVRRNTRFPCMEHLWPKIDQRKATLSLAKTGTTFEAWLRLSTLKPGERIDLPLVVTPQLRERLALADTVPRPPKKPRKKRKKNQRKKQQDLAAQPTANLDGVSEMPSDQVISSQESVALCEVPSVPLESVPDSGRSPSADHSTASPLPLPLPGFDCLALTVQLLPRPNGSLVVAVFTDMAGPFAQTRAAYVPLEDTVAIDWGLTTLAATDRGDLLGRGYMEQLSRYDKVLTTIATARQQAGLKIRSPRYDRWVTKLRGFIKSEVNRVLNRLVDRLKPGRLILENVDFRGGGMSRRLNRLVSLMGRSALKAKLADLEQRLGIVVEFREAAYTSKECHRCGFVSPNNRKNQALFQCRYCGTQCHADVNGARVLRKGRSLAATGSTATSRRRILVERLQGFCARFPTPRAKELVVRTWELRLGGKPGDGSCLRLLTQQDEDQPRALPDLNWTVKKGKRAARQHGQPTLKSG